MKSPDASSPGRVRRQIETKTSSASRSLSIAHKTYEVVVALVVCAGAAINENDDPRISRGGRVTECRPKPARRSIRKRFDVNRRFRVGYVLFQVDFLNVVQTVLVRYCSQTTPCRAERTGRCSATSEVKGRWGHPTDYKRGAVPQGRVLAIRNPKLLFRVTGVPQPRLAERK